MLGKAFPGSALKVLMLNHREIMATETDKFLGVAEVEAGVPLQAEAGKL